MVIYLARTALELIWLMAVSYSRIRSTRSSLPFKTSHRLGHRIRTSLWG